MLLTVLISICKAIEKTSMKLPTLFVVFFSFKKVLRLKSKMKS